MIYFYITFIHCVLSIGFIFLYRFARFSGIPRFLLNKYIVSFYR